MRRLRMRGRIAMMAMTVAAATVMGSALPASAAPILDVKGGTTKTVSTPEIGRALIKAGIVPIPVGGAKLKGIDLKTLQMTTSLPVASGRLDQGAFFAGDATHKGGLMFINFLKFRSVTVSDFKVYIDFADPRLEARVDNNPRKTVKLFRIDISGVKLGGNGVDELVLGNNGLILTDEGAALLNSKLKTSAFKAGAKFGVADTTFKYTVAP